MKIGTLDTEKRIIIVAEIGNNHEGSFNEAIELIKRAAQAGADAVKFQTCVPELFVSSKDPKRRHQLHKFRFSFEQFRNLAKVATDEGIIFFSTPLDLESAAFLNDIQPVFKISSGDNNFYPLIDMIAGYRKPIILSTGLLDLPGVQKTTRRLTDAWQHCADTPGLAVLHCVASYPVPDEQTNLASIQVLQRALPSVIVGYSDHTLGTRACELSVAAGARIIEKHFTLDKTRSTFRDHQLSADPRDLKEMVGRIRDAEKMFGKADKMTQLCEQPMTTAIRRSIAARRALAAGTMLSMEELTWLRPGGGIPPGEEQKLLGRILKRDLAEGELVHEADVAESR